LIVIVFFKIFPIPAWIVLCVWMGLQLFSGVTADVSQGGVAYWAHAGGFFAGLVLMIPFWLRLGGQQFWQRSEGHPPHPEARYSPSTIPMIGRRK
jgi:membrane associated rhomboid family serine protease